MGLKLMVVGHGRHGKDTVCEILRDEYKLRFTSSSLACAEMVMMPIFGDKYKTAEECFADRHTGENRRIWYDAITAYNVPDASRLGRLIFSKVDIYAGIRNKKEFHACKNAGLFFKSIWVDRSDHQPPEKPLSMTIEPWMADYVLDNNGSLVDLRNNLYDLMRTITKEFWVWQRQF